MRVAIVGDKDSSLTRQLADRFAGSGVEVAGPDLDVEALLEAAPFDAAIDDCVVDADRKRDTLVALERSLADGAPLLSNASAAAATLMAAWTGQPERLLGYALLPPWDDRTTIECSRALQTADAYAAAAEAVWRAAGFETVWVGDSAGLVLPRIVACLANEAAFAVMERVAQPEDVDRAMELGTRYPRGPLAWAEAIGLERVVATLDALASEQGDDRYRVAPLLRHMAIARAPLAAPGRDA